MHTYKYQILFPKFTHAARIRNNLSYSNVIFEINKYHFNYLTSFDNQTCFVMKRLAIFTRNGVNSLTTR